MSHLPRCGALLPRPKPIKDDTPPRLRRAERLVEGVSLFDDNGDGHPDAFRNLSSTANYLGDEFPAIFADWRGRHDEAQAKDDARGRAILDAVRARRDLAAAVTPVEKPPPLAPAVSSPPPVTPKPRVRAVSLS